MMHNVFGQIERLRIPAAAAVSGQNEDTTFTYEPVQGDLTKVVDPVGDAMTVGPYDALGDPLGFRVFPDTGDPNTSLNPLITSLDWNAAQEIIWARLPNPETVTITWTHGLVTSTEFRSPGNIFSFFMDFIYDSRARLKLVTVTVKRTR